MNLQSHTMVYFIIINTSFHSPGSRKEDLRTQFNHATKCLIWDVD
jgi:hypothetical protein